MASVNHIPRKRRLESISSTGETERKVKSYPSLSAADGTTTSTALVTTTSRERTSLTPSVQKLKAYDAREDGLRSLATCKICFRMLYEPYTLGCGHTYCYSCLCQWFDNSGKKGRKTCPDCRTAVTKPPAPAYALREMIRELLRHPELLPDTETVADHKCSEMEEAAAVETDRANKDEKRGGLFKGVFKSTTRGDMGDMALLMDSEDGVMRCPRCAWEWEDEGGVCGRCDYHLYGGSDEEEDEDFHDDDDDDSDEEDEVDADDLDHPYADHQYGMDDQFEFGFDRMLQGHHHWDEDHPIVIHDGTPPPAGHVHYDLTSSPSYHTAGSDASGEDSPFERRYESSDDEDSSLDGLYFSFQGRVHYLLETGFVARDDEDAHHGSHSDSDDSSSTHTATPVPTSSSQSRRGRRIIEEDEDDEDDVEDVEDVEEDDIDEDSENQSESASDSGSETLVRQQHMHRSVEDTSSTEVSSDESDSDRDLRPTGGRVFGGRPVQGRSVADMERRLGLISR